MPKSKAKSWATRADANMFHGFTDVPSIQERGAMVLTHGEGAYVVDVDGNRYLDANSGLWNMIAGFDHPGLIEAAQAQYARFPGYHSLFGRMSDQTVELSEKLIEVSPFERGKVFYTNSGSEANDSMAKMLWFMDKSRGMPVKRKILSLKNGYHGVTTASASMTGKPYNDLFGLPLEGFIHLTCPHYWAEGQPGETEEEFTQRLADEMEQTIRREGAQMIAGFFAEPVLGVGGVITPPKGYFQAIAPILKRHHIPFIADEVICGFGRTGNMWGCETFDFMPDAIVTSKALTAGMFPMGAVILGPELSDILQTVTEEVGEFPHGFTTAGHPVGCAIALKTIDVLMNEGLAENVRSLTPKFQAGLKRLAKHANVGEWRGVGLMGALELVQDKATKTPFAANLAISERIANACADLGLICRPLGQAIVLCPPFIITEAQMDEMFKSLEKALKSVIADVK